MSVVDAAQPSLPYFRRATDRNVKKKPIRNYHTILESKREFDMSVHSIGVAYRKEKASKDSYDYSLCRLWDALCIVP
jgi:hypothetical protein